MINVKTTSIHSVYVAFVSVHIHKVDDNRNAYIKGQILPHPLRGQTLIEMQLFGPRGGPKDGATFTKAQAKELGTALLSLAGGESETE